MKSHKEIFNAVLRNDFMSFIKKAFPILHPGETLGENWLVRCLAHELEKCVKGGSKRLIICVPPRHLKSFLGSTALPAWLLGRDPCTKVICISYSQDLATKFHQDCHQIVEAPFYQDCFPGMHLADKPNNDQEYATTKKGFRKATSVGGVLTGYGADFIIIDDPLKPHEAQSEALRSKVNCWYGDTVISRLDNQATGVIIIITQRTHVDDLVGHVKDLDDWRVISVPAIAEITTSYEVGHGEVYVRKAGTVIDPARQTQQQLNSVKKSMTSYLFSAQYQQEPTIKEGAIVKFDWFNRYETAPSYFDFVAQVWDTASTVKETSDYSVCATFGVRGHRYFLIDLFRGQTEYPALRQKAVGLIHEHKPDVVLVEGAGVGFALYSELVNSGYNQTLMQHPQGGKITRVQEQLHKLTEGRVHLPETALWLLDFRNEVTAFPHGKNDDQVDVLEAFLRNVDGLRQRVALWGKDGVFNSFDGGIPPGVQQLSCKVTVIG